MRGEVRGSLLPKDPYKWLNSQAGIHSRKGLPAPSSVLFCCRLSPFQIAIRNATMEKASEQIRLSKLALEGSRRAGFSGQGSQGLPGAGPGWAGSGGVIRRGEITLELVVVSWVSWASKAANGSTQSGKAQAWPHCLWLWLTRQPRGI